jgi:hypothetical protein
LASALLKSRQPIGADELGDENPTHRIARHGEIHSGQEATEAPNESGALISGLIIKITTSRLETVPHNATYALLNITIHTWLDSYHAVRLVVLRHGDNAIPNGLLGEATIGALIGGTNTLFPQWVEAYSCFS